MFAPQVAARGVPVAEFNMENTPATMKFKYVSFSSHTLGTRATVNRHSFLSRLQYTHTRRLFPLFMFQVPLPRPLWVHATPRAGTPRGRANMRHPLHADHDLIGTNSKKNGLKCNERFGGGLMKRETACSR